MRLLFIWALAINFLGALAAQTVLVPKNAGWAFVKEPLLVGTWTVSVCGATYTMTNMPNSLGMGCGSNSVDITTVLWDSSFVSVGSSLETWYTYSYGPAGLQGGTCSLAWLQAAQTIKSSFPGTHFHYTVYEPVSIVPSTFSSTVTVTEETETVTFTLAPSAVTVSVAVGSGGMLTYYTTGPVSGTSTKTTCA